MPKFGNNHRLSKPAMNFILVLCKKFFKEVILNFFEFHLLSMREIKPCCLGLIENNETLFGFDPSYSAKGRIKRRGEQKRPRYFFYQFSMIFKISKILF